MPTEEEFYKQINSRKLPIKSLLLKQDFSAGTSLSLGNVASSSLGVGNWIADEVLYQARIHPERSASSLSREESDALRFQIQDVCRVRHAFLHIVDWNRLQ